MPTEITDVDELQAMSADLAGSYILMNDIDASATSGWNAGAGFDPIGTESSVFSGSLNFNGFDIDGLFLNRGARSVGLFGV